MIELKAKNENAPLFIEKITLHRSKHYTKQYFIFIEKQKITFKGTLFLVHFLVFLRSNH